MKRANNLDSKTLADALAHAAGSNYDYEYFIYGPYGLMAAAARRIDQLQNEVNAVEWMNGRIEKELFDCRKRS